MAPRRKHCSHQVCLAVYMHKCHWALVGPGEVGATTAQMFLHLAAARWQLSAIVTRPLGFVHSGLPKPSGSLCPQQRILRARTSSQSVAYQSFWYIQLHEYIYIYMYMNYFLQQFLLLISSFVVIVAIVPLVTAFGTQSPARLSVQAPDKRYPNKSFINKFTGRFATTQCSCKARTRGENVFAARR